MPSAVLIVASTRVHADVQEILRIQDTASALIEQGRAVDLLVPSTLPYAYSPFPSFPYAATLLHAPPSAA